MTRRVLLSLLAAALTLAAVPVRAHDEYRFVGTVVKWDAKKQKLDIAVKETTAEGKVVTATLRIGMPDDVLVMRLLKKVPRSELKPGLLVVVDAVGIEMTELDATEVEIVQNQPKK